MAQNVSIQALTGVESTDLDLKTPIPLQRANVDKFESAEIGQIKNTIYARCETAGSTTAKVAYLTNFPNCRVSQGTVITVIFDNANTADNITLKLQDSSKNDITGNISVMALNSALLQLGAGSIKANSRIKLEYDGTYWQAHSDIVKSSSSSVTHADGTVSYTAISSLTDGSSAPVNTNAVKGALADLTQIKNITVNNDTEFWSAFSNPSQCTRIININYESTLLNGYGTFVCSFGSDTNAVNGIFTKLYNSISYQVNIIISSQTINIKETALKSDLTDYQPKLNYTDVWINVGETGYGQAQTDIEWSRMKSMALEYDDQMYYGSLPTIAFDINNNFLRFHAKTNTGGNWTVKIRVWLIS